MESFIMLINNNIYINYKTLKDITQYLHALTDAQIAILDSEGRIVYGCPEKQKEFCTLIAQKFHDQKICYLCDKEAAKRCKETLNSYSYICHAGVSETIIPLIYERKIYLYLMIGQYINIETEKEQYLRFRYYCRCKNISDSILIEEYNNLPKLSTQKVTAFIQISQLLFISLWESEIIKVRKNDLFLDIETFIDENISSPLTIQTICSHFFISKNNLYQIFEEYCGLTVKKYIIEKRINLAKELLAFSNATITEISEKIGISNYGAFIQLFKNVVGISPSKYRKNYKNII